MGNISQKEQLYSAIEGGRIDKIRELISQDQSLIDEPMTTDCVTNPLQRACWRGDCEIVQLLISLGANINFMKQNQCSPLMWAAKRDHVQVIKILLKQKYIQIELEDSNNLNAFDYALIYNSKNSALLLQQKGFLIPKKIEFYNQKAKQLKITNYRYVEFQKVLIELYKKQFLVDSNEFHSQLEKNKMDQSIQQDQMTDNDYSKILTKMESRNNLNFVLDGQNKNIIIDNNNEIKIIKEGQKTLAIQDLELEF